MDWWDVLKGEAEGDLVDQVAEALGETPEKAKKGVDGAVPAILGELVGLAADEGGRERLYRAVETSDGAGYGNLVGNLAEGRAHALMEVGVREAGGLLDAERGARLSQALQQYAAFDKPESSGGMLAMLLPFVLAWLGKRAKQDGLDAGGLASMLLKNKELIAKLLPVALAGMMGKKRGGGAARQGGGLRRLLPLLLFGVAAFFLWKTCQPSAPPPSGDTPPREAASTASVVDLANDLRTALVGVRDGGDVEAAKRELERIDAAFDVAVAQALPPAVRREARAAVMSVVRDLAERHVIRDAYAKTGAADTLGPVVTRILGKMKAFVE